MLIARSLPVVLPSGSPVEISRKLIYPYVCYQSYVYAIQSIVTTA